MVDKIKLLERLEERVAAECQEITFVREEDFNDIRDWLDKATHLMKRIYDDIKTKYPQERIIQQIERYYDDAWDVLYPSSYADMLNSDP